MNMKKISKGFYIAGFITNILAIFGFLLAICIFSLVKDNDSAIQEFLKNNPNLNWTFEGLKLAMALAANLSIFLIVASIATALLGFFAIKKAESDDKKDTTFHIVTLVLGFLTNYLYCVASLLWLCSQKDENKTDSKVIDVSSEK